MSEAVQAAIHEDSRNSVDGVILNTDPSVAGKPGVPEPIPCEYCGKLRPIKGFSLGNTLVWGPYGPERCDCPESVAAYEKEQADKKSAEEAARTANEQREQRARIDRIIGD